MNHKSYFLPANTKHLTLEQKNIITERVCGILTNEEYWKKMLFASRPKTPGTNAKRVIRRKKLERLVG